MRGCVHRRFEVFAPQGPKQPAEYPGQMWQELNSRGYELDFDVDSQGVVVITLRDLDGRILRNIAASQAVEIACARPGPDLDRLLRS